MIETTECRAAPALGLARAVLISLLGASLLICLPSEPAGATTVTAAAAVRTAAPGQARCRAERQVSGAAPMAATATPAGLGPADLTVANAVAKT